MVDLYGAFKKFEVSAESVDDFIAKFYRHPAPESHIRFHHQQVGALGYTHIPPEYSRTYRTVSWYFKKGL